MIAFAAPSRVLITSCSATDITQRNTKLVLGQGSMASKVEVEQTSPCLTGGLPTTKLVWVVVLGKERLPIAVDGNHRKASSEDCQLRTEAGSS
jgi:hypothetical protein